MYGNAIALEVHFNFSVFINAFLFSRNSLKLWYIWRDWLDGKQVIPAEIGRKYNMI